MKKFLSCVLCLAMVASMGVTAFASEVVPLGPVNPVIQADGGSENVLVTYGMSSGFVVTIPATVNLDAEGKGSCQISAENVMIAANHTLQVSLGSEDYANTGSWELVDANAPDNTLTYTIGKVAGASDVTNNTVVLSVNAGESYQSVSGRMLHFSIVDELTKAGEYTDTLTFTVNVVNNPQNQ